MTVRTTFALALVITTPAAAHMAQTGWAYDSGCCGGYDCAAIPDEWVKVTSEGYLVSIPIGWKLVHTQVFTLIPYDKARKSGDEHYHACVTTGQEFRCFFAPHSST